MLQTLPAEAEVHPFRLLRPYWRVVLAALLGWFLDAFDQMVLVFLLVRLSHEFSVSLVAMGVIITAQSWGRVAGNTLWGIGADRWGRKLAFMVGVIWFAVCSGLSGLAWSYGAMLVIQVLFGIGFGGEWTASAALLMESVPARARSVASALMMSGYEFGYFAAAAANALILPRWGWRPMFFIGVIPALLAIFIRWGIPESPVWLASRGKRESLPPRRRYRITWAAVQGWAFMAVLQFQNVAIFAFYPAFLQQVHHLSPEQVFPYAAVYSVASIIGKPLCGWIASRLGHRPTVIGYLVLTCPGAFLFTMTTGPVAIAAGAFVMGIIANSIFALVPDYLSRRFGSNNRSFGMGLGYALAAAGGSVASFAVPWLGTSMGLAGSMEVLIIAGSIAAAAVAALEPRDLPGRVMETDGEASAA
jgi:SHS family lactate transporter-like MFS transporter